MAQHVSTIDEYIRPFPDDVQLTLEEIRRTVLEVAPDAGEKISYQIPTMTLDGRNLVHFAAWKHHIALYPLPTGDAAFEKEIAPYRGTKGTARFPLGEPIPYHLIKQLIMLLVERRNDG